jgi:hypothetical protein
MATQQEMLEQLVRLTSAVQSLAERHGHDHREPAEVSDADLVRQRVAFGYQALGALTGRVGSASGREFDVLVLQAERYPGVIHLDGLPGRANWVELRRGTKVELLRVHEDQRTGVTADPAEASSPNGDGEGSPRRHRDRGSVFPRLFVDEEEIGSVVALRTRRGPLVAFGPRLPALPSYSDRSTA